MRLIGIIAVAAVSAPPLASCSGSDYPKEPWMAYDQECEQLGFARGTPEHDKCRLELAREATPQGASRATTE
jgi:hypothetical protein